MPDKYTESKSKFSNNDAFIPEGLGSAERVSLDGKSEIEGYVTETGVRNKVNVDEMPTDFSTRGAPWDLDQSFKAKCAEIGVDFNQFIEGLKAGKSDEEIADEVGIKTKAAANLRYHFESFGYHSMQGQD